MARDFVEIQAFSKAREELLATDIDLSTYAEKLIALSAELESEGLKFLGATVLMNSAPLEIQTIIKHTDSADFPLTVNLNKAQDYFFVGPPRITNQSQLNYIKNAIGFWEPKA